MTARLQSPSITSLFPELIDYDIDRIKEFDVILCDRQAELIEVSTFIRDRWSRSETVKLISICTQN